MIILCLGSPEGPGVQNKKLWGCREVFPEQTDAYEHDPALPAQGLADLIVWANRLCRSCLEQIYQFWTEWWKQELCAGVVLSIWSRNILRWEGWRWRRASLNGVLPESMPSLAV